MKKILLLSDTHGHCDASMLHHCAEADEIWHAGDWGPDVEQQLLKTGKTLRGVYGNIDDQHLRLAFPEREVFTVEGLSVAMIHIGGYPGHYSRGVKEWLSGLRPDLMICGHSHILRVMRDPSIGGMLHMNPGAAGVHGFHKMRTMIRFQIHEGRVLKPEVIELGLRGNAEGNMG